MTKVFVHGNPETSAIWKPLVAALSERGVNDVVLLSPPGFGAPVSHDWTATVSEYRNWLAGELEKIGGEIDLVGHDWGAGHVFSVLAHRPELVRSWATDCVGLLHPDYVWHDAALGWQTPEIGEQIVAAMLAMEEDVFADSFVQLGMTDAIAREVKLSVNEDMGSCVLRLYRDAAQPAMSRLGERLIVHRPSHGLVFIADQDHFAGTVSMMEEMAEVLDADVARLAQCGHWWMIQNPDAAAEHLVRHWGR
jgi:pimeloyl-ACP methyl ester carboxylesterase